MTHIPLGIQPVTWDDRTRDANERDAWCATRRPGNPLATFGPGEKMRCPGAKTLRSQARVVCGEYIGTVRGDSRAVVRCGSGMKPPPPFFGGYDRRCPNCAGLQEVFTVALATFDVLDQVSAGVGA